MRGAITRKRIAMHADTRAGGKFGAHSWSIECDSIIAGLRHLAGVIETRAIAWLRWRARLGGHGVSGNRHHQNVAEIGMPSAREMRVAETLYGWIVVLIAGGVRVAVSDNTTGVGIRRKLHHAERR